MQDKSHQLEFCPALQHLLGERVCHGKSGREFTNLGSLSTINNLVTLRELMIGLKPARTLEVGLCFGGSGLVFTATHRDLGHAPTRQHVALDPYQSSVWDGCGLQNIDRAGLAGYLDFRPNFSSLELPKLVGEDNRFGLVYVDGSHLIEDVFVDAYFVTRLLTDDGVVAFDDSSDPHVRKVLKFLRTNCRMSLKEIDLGPYRADRGTTLRYRAARMLGKVQMTAFRRIGQIDRDWNAPYHPF